MLGGPDRFASMDYPDEYNELDPVNLYRL